MKKFILSVMATMAIISLPAFAQQLTEDSPHLYLMLHGTDLDGMNMNIDADLDREQAGDETNKGAGDAGKEKNDVLYQHLHQEVNFRQGAVPVGQEFDWGRTRTRFRVEISTNAAMNDDGFLKLYYGDAVKIASELLVDEDDVGKLAQCLVVVQYNNKVGDYGEPSNFMLSEQGWKDWKGGFSNLAGVPCELGEMQKIIAHEGELFSGEFDFYFGYKLKDGKIVHSSVPFSFTVQ